MSEKTKASKVARTLAEEIVTNTDLYIWDVSFAKEGSDWYLKLLIDTPQGISIGELEDFNRKLSVKLDEVDPIPEGYFLEVSSPGLERSLTRDEHFKMMVGEEICISLYKAVDGEKEFRGRLKEKKDGIIYLVLEDESVLSFGEKEVAKVRLNFNF